MFHPFRQLVAALLVLTALSACVNGGEMNLEELQATVQAVATEGNDTATDARRQLAALPDEQAIGALVGVFTHPQAAVKSRRWAVERLFVRGAAGFELATQVAAYLATRDEGVLDTLAESVASKPDGLVDGLGTGKLRFRELGAHLQPAWANALAHSSRADHRLRCYTALTTIDQPPAAEVLIETLKTIQQAGPAYFSNHPMADRLAEQLVLDLADRGDPSVLPLMEGFGANQWATMGARLDRAAVVAAVRLRGDDGFDWLFNEFVGDGDRVLLVDALRELDDPRAIPLVLNDWQEWLGGDDDPDRRRQATEGAREDLAGFGVELGSSDDPFAWWEEQGRDRFPEAASWWAEASKRLE